MTALASVSIIIATYNSAKTVGRAVRSALADPGVSEVVVSDDGSDDDTLLILDELKLLDDRVKVISSETNRGPSAARNSAIAESKGEWIGILDADDVLLENRIASLLSYSTSADLIADHILRVDEANLEGPRTALFRGMQLAPTEIAFVEFIKSNIPHPSRPRGELGFLKPIIRRSFLQDHSINYDERLRLGEDYELYARALAHGARMLVVPFEGYLAVVRRTSLSGLHTIADLKNLRDCDISLSKIASLSAEGRRALKSHYLNTDCRLQWRVLIRAMKHREVVNCVKAFLRPMPVPLYLIQQLAIQAYVRLFSGKGQNGA